MGDGFVERGVTIMPDSERDDITLKHGAKPLEQTSEHAWAAGMAAAFGQPEEPVFQDFDPGQRTGEMLGGKYALIELIAEGGMGSVWLAQQSEPVKRKVAVKLIKAGMDTRQVVIRFEAERQALAMMDHPNIAKILDGGLHENRPYFVMELVNGVPITEYCDRERLTPEQRLELFVPVCQAIQHAHQKGLIHRDIKPSNVLVAISDGRAVPKVIDFGVAKAAIGTLTEHTLDTDMGGVIGTPQYMSPEQATFDNLDIDTRSDVYSLGVLLYELLVGSPPFAKADLEKRGMLEILRVVREEEPPRPSIKLSTNLALPSLSANRGMEPKKLAGILRRELDWIVLKALEKDRTRRYDSANGFAADVLRYLNGETVEAHPPNKAYRLKKFLRKNRGPVIAASLVFTTLLIGIVGTTFGYLEAKRQETLASERAEGERLAKLDAQAQEKFAVDAAAAEKVAKLMAVTKQQEAEKNLAFAQKGNDILGSIFTGLDPKANYTTVAEMRKALRENLNKAVQELEGSALGDPLTVAAMQNKLGQSFYGLGDAKSAVLVLEKASVTYQATLGIENPETLKLLNNLAQAYEAAGMMDKSRRLSQETFTAMTTHFGPEHPITLYGMNNLASGYLEAGKLELALPMLEKVLEIRTARLGPNHIDTLRSMSNLAAGYQAAGKKDKALPLFEESLVLRRKLLGQLHPDTLTSMANLATSYHLQSKPELALPLLEETLRLRREILGPEHPDTLTVMSNLAVSYALAGKLHLAIPFYEDALRSRAKTLGPNHPETVSSRTYLALAYVQVRASNKLVTLSAEQSKSARARLAKETPALANELAAIGKNLHDVNKWAEAEPLLEECLAIREKTQPNHWLTFYTQSLLGSSRLGQKKHADAEPLLLQGYEGMKARMGSIPPQAAHRIPEALDRLIKLSMAMNRPEDTQKYRTERAKYLEVAPLPREKK
jgi:eukaryotic-like serine/threonine-protein kinase